jgi:branched-chain amino acid transport system permease protein
MADLSRFNLRDIFGNWWEKASPAKRGIVRVLVIALFYALPLLNNPIIDTPETSFQSVLFYPLIMFSLMAVGLNVVVGKSGILDLGYVAFFAIGAYTHALIGIKTDLNFYETLPIAMAMSMLAGLILGLPALRLRGDYLAIITLGFGEIVRIIAVNTEAIGGAAGLTDIPAPPSILGLEFGSGDPRPYYWLTLTITILIIWGILRLSHRKPGRAWEAIRQDEDAAELMGVPTLKYKIWSFTLGAAIGGAAGVLYASKNLFIAPEMFTLNVSILILACVVFGGIGNIWGVIVGATILGYLPDRIRFISDARLWVFGLVLVIVMNIRPDGLLPRKKREKAIVKKGAN